jgi:hypothetical protein
VEPRRKEPRREEPRAPAPRPEEKQKRFRLIKLEERIAPRRGTNGTGINDSQNQTGYSIE